MNTLSEPIIELEFVEPEPVDPLDSGPGWWLFGPDEITPFIPLLCPACAGMGTIDGFEPCRACAGTGDNPSWWL